MTTPQQVVVLGPYPDYLKLAEQIDAEAFSMPAEIWNALTDAERWEANQAFLDDAVQRGVVFQLAIPPDEARAGSYFAQEFDYLISQGFKVRLRKTHWEMFR